MKRKAWTKTVVIVGIALLLIALPMLGACGAKEEEKPAPTAPPVAGPAKKVTITVGGLLPLTGPGAEFGRIFSRSFDDFWRYYREEVKTLPAGVEIDFRLYDFEYDPAKAVLVVKRMIEQDGAVAYAGWGGTTDPATFPIQLKHQVPNVTAMMLGPVAWPPTLRFAPMYSYNDEAKGQIRWFVENQWKESRAPKIALMYQDTPWGLTVVKPAKEYAKVIGAEIVAEVAVPMSPLDVKTELSGVRKAGADVILARHIATPYAQILKDEKALGMSIPLMGGVQAFNPVIQILAEKEANGLIFAATPYPDWIDEQDPEAGKPIRKLRELFGKYHPDKAVEEDLTVWPSLNNYFLAWGEVACLARAIEIAATQVGAENIDGPAMVNALRSIRDFDLYLPRMKPLRTYAPDDQRGTRELRILGFKDGEWVVVQDWMEVPEVSPAEMRGEW